MNTPLFVVLFDVESVGRQVIREVIGTAADILYLPDVDRRGPRCYGGRRSSWRRIRPGIDARRTRTHPPGAAVAVLHGGGGFYAVAGLAGRSADCCQQGASAEPMAEHALALTLAAVKRLLQAHQLATGPSISLRRTACWLASLWPVRVRGDGRRRARLMRAMGMQIHAINRRGHSAEPTDWIGTPEQLDVLLARWTCWSSRLRSRATGAHWRAGAGPHEGRRHPGESSAGRDHRGRRAVCPPATASRVPRASMPGGSSRCGTGRFGCSTRSWSCPM